ncbi:MAG TPA: Rieske (2Fe-2S) protein [Pirellulales bacterium]|nr:Rieske (2Fe-2S) protein [Pirellulales bacterium]
MADKKKMSVAEILAAARKADVGNKAAGSSPEPKASAESEPAASESAPSGVSAVEPAAVETPTKVEKPAAKPKPAGAAGRPSVAEMLAAARAGGGTKPAAAGAEAKPAPKPAAAEATEKGVGKAEKGAGKAEKGAEKTGTGGPRQAKPSEKSSEKPVKAASPVGGPKDTASILASARTHAKPGPLSKAEAAARLQPEAPAPAKPAKGAVPPMPAKPTFAKPKPGMPPSAKAEGAVEDRRGFLAFMAGAGALVTGSFLGVGFTSLAATLGLWTLGTARFMFPNVLVEPPSKFKVGFPSDFAPGQVEEKFKAQFGVWVAKAEYQGQLQIYALRTVCTHLGCTPNWLEGEQKFKCPCHGSGFYKDGINFEGPAPRPLERYAIRLADDGQLEIDKSKLFQEEMGQWSNPDSFVPV